jgi:hypothetical protein
MMPGASSQSHKNKFPVTQKTSSRSQQKQVPGHIQKQAPGHSENWEKMVFRPITGQTAEHMLGTLLGTPPGTLSMGGVGSILKQHQRLDNLGIPLINEMDGG